MEDPFAAPTVSTRTRNLNDALSSTYVGAQYELAPFAPDSDTVSPRRRTVEPPAFRPLASGPVGAWGEPAADGALPAALQPPHVRLSAMRICRFLAGVV